MPEEVPAGQLLLKDLIHFWEVQLGDKGLFSITTQQMIEETIKRLKRLHKLEYENKIV